MSVCKSNHIVSNMADRFIELIKQDINQCPRWVMSDWVSNFLKRAFIGELYGGELFDGNQDNPSEFEKVMTLAFYFRDKDEGSSLMFSAMESILDDTFSYFYNEVVAEVNEKFEQIKKERGQ